MRGKEWKVKGVSVNKHIIDSKIDGKVGEDRTAQLASGAEPV